MNYTSDIIKEQQLRFDHQPKMRQLLRHEIVCENPDSSTLKRYKLVFHYNDGTTLETDYNGRMINGNTQA